MGGAVIILFAMFIAGPIGVFALGAVWSAVNGWFLVADADARGEEAGTPAG